MKTKVFNNIVCGSLLFFSNIEPVLALDEDVFRVKSESNIEIGLEQKLIDYDIEFKIYNPKFKNNFRIKYKIDLKGDYSFNDFKLIEEVFDSYGEKWIKDLNFKKIYFLSKNLILYNNSGVNNLNKIEDQAIAGLAYRDGSKIVLKSKEKPYVLFHELSHIHHFNIEKKFPNFNVEWKNISGGYINEEQLISFSEDIAELSEAILTEGFEEEEYNLIKITDKLPVFDGNFMSLKNKIKMLYNYNFFPSKFNYGNLNYTNKITK